MIKEIVSERMDSLGLPYAYWEFPREDEPVYYVGERIEAPQRQEDGARTGTFVVGGWSYEGVSLLDDAEPAIRDAFGDLRVRNALGTCCVSYSHTAGVPSDVEGIARVDHTLDYIEWSNE